MILKVSELLSFVVKFRGVLLINHPLKPNMLSPWWGGNNWLLMAAGHFTPTLEENLVATTDDW